MSSYLMIYGASDDLVEFEGVYTEEYNVYEATTFEIVVSNETRGSYRAAEQTTLWVRAEFGRNDWELSVATRTNCVDLDVEVEFTQRPGCDGDPAIVIHPASDDTVTVRPL